MIKENKIISEIDKESFMKKELKILITIKYEKTINKELQRKYPN